MIYYAVMWINSLQNKNGILQKYSPQEIVTRQKMDFKKYCLCKLGEYIESRGDYYVTKNMPTRTHEEFSLGPSSNLHGTQKLFYIKTGPVLKQHVNTVVSMPYQVIKKKNKWGEKTKKNYGSKLIFIKRTKKVRLGKLWPERGRGSIRGWWWNINWATRWNAKYWDLKLRNSTRNRCWGRNN